MNAEAFFLQHLAEIERAIAFVCRRHGLRGADADDFGCRAKLKIIDRDYAVLRKFESRCSFHSFMVIVITRMLMDERNHERGKWRSSAQARRLGTAAVLLEILLHRDGRSFDEAVETIGSRLRVERRELERLAARLPSRKSRPREVPLAESAVCRIAAVASGVETPDRIEFACKVARVLRQAMEQLSDHDRLIFRMRFEADMTVAEIARSLQIPQKPIYRVLSTQLKKMRQILERSGINAGDIEDILGLPSTPLDRSLRVSTDGSASLPATEE